MLDDDVEATFSFVIDKSHNIEDYITCVVLMTDACLKKKDWAQVERIYFNTKNKVLSEQKRLYSQSYLYVLTNLALSAANLNKYHRAKRLFQYVNNRINSIDGFKPSVECMRELNEIAIYLESKS
ncbi:hypothetical protein JV59_33710 [Vibrio coralliilyticus]|nr:hypothetical protein JV59_33710 [Vibrio coralliilyticus]